MPIEDPPPAPGPSGELKTILGVAAAGAGLMGYIYLAGWVVDLVQFSAARLPAGPATSALSSGQIFGDGLRSTLLMAAVFAASCLLAWLSASRRWDIHGQDWHDIVRKGGVAKAASEANDEERRLREALHAQRKVERADKVATHVKLPLVTHVARLIKTRNPPRASACPLEKPGLKAAPLGDWAVRVIAGFNVMVLSGLVAVIVVRAVGAAIPSVRWIGLILGVGAFFLARWTLTLASPLLLGSRFHGMVWVVVAVAALFASAPIGVLVLTAVALATLGRSLARVKQPSSFEEFLRSPLPWALLTVCLFLGLAYNATPPVSFSQVLVSTTTGNRSGGYLTRTSAGIYVVTCTPLADATSTQERLDFVPAADIKVVRIGGHGDYLDSGTRPSIATLALDALGTGGRAPTLFNADLRAAQPTCADAGPSSLTAGTRDPALGNGVIAGPAPAGGRAHNGEPPIQNTNSTSASIAALARLYQPTLLVTVADRNWPVSVNAVLSERGPGNEPVCLVQNREPRSVCPPSLSSLGGKGAAPSDYLQLPVGLGSHQGPDGQFQAFLTGQYIDPGPLHGWLADPGLLDPWYTAQIYFYYAGPLRSSQFPPKAIDPAPSGLIGLEYWFYYPLNYYPLVVNSDLMNRAPLAGDHANVDLHQGDWEHIDVLLDPQTKKPVWLYMARHSFEGQFVPWNSPGLTFDRGHPVVQAAFGGHPTYLPGCGARPRKATFDLSSDWLSCGSGRFAFRAASTPLADLAQLSWACWPGHFGEASSQLEVQAAHQPENVIDSVKHFVYVAGPQSPLQQAENTGACKGNPAAAELAKGAGLPRRGARR